MLEYCVSNRNYHKAGKKLTMLDTVVDQELSGYKAGGHDHPRPETCEEAAEPGLPGKHNKPRCH